MSIKGWAKNDKNSLFVGFEFYKLLKKADTLLFYSAVSFPGQIRLKTEM